MPPLKKKRKKKSKIYFGTPVHNAIVEYNEKLEDEKGGIEKILDHIAKLRTKYDVYKQSYEEVQKQLNDLNKQLIKVFETDK